MKKILLATIVLMSFACSPRVSICKKAAACSDEISDADTDRCIEEAKETDEEQSKFDNEECDAFLEADHDYYSCLNANGECNDGVFGTSQCDDEFEKLVEESFGVAFEDCDG